jgi:hypothetical protein
MHYSKNHIRSPLKTHELVTGVGKMLNAIGYTSAVDACGEFIKIPSREEKQEELKAKRFVFHSCVYVSMCVLLLSIFFFFYVRSSGTLINSFLQSLSLSLSL